MTPDLRRRQPRHLFRTKGFPKVPSLTCYSYRKTTSSSSLMNMHAPIRKEAAETNKPNVYSMHSDYPTRPLKNTRLVITSSKVKGMIHTISHRRPIRSTEVSTTVIPGNFTTTSQHPTLRPNALHPSLLTKQHSKTSSRARLMQQFFNVAPDLTNDRFNVTGPTKSSVTNSSDSFHFRQEGWLASSLGYAHLVYLIDLQSLRELINTSCTCGTSINNVTFHSGTIRNNLKGINLALNSECLKMEHEINTLIKIFAHSDFIAQEPKSALRFAKSKQALRLR